jgi:hypothetical protein
VPYANQSSQGSYFKQRVEFVDMEPSNSDRLALTKVKPLIDSGHDENVRLLVRWALARKKNATITSLAVFERQLGLSRASSVELARRIEKLGCGRLVLGRRSHRSRVEWFEGGLWKAVAALTKYHGDHAKDDK